MITRTAPHYVLYLDLHPATTYITYYPDVVLYPDPDHFTRTYTTRHTIPDTTPDNTPPYPAPVPPLRSIIPRSRNYVE